MVVIWVSKCQNSASNACPDQAAVVTETGTSATIRRRIDLRNMFERNSAPDVARKVAPGEAGTSILTSLCSLLMKMDRKENIISSAIPTDPQTQSYLFNHGKLQKR